MFDSCYVTAALETGKDAAGYLLQLFRFTCFLTSFLTYPTLPRLTQVLLCCVNGVVQDLCPHTVCAQSLYDL